MKKAACIIGLVGILSGNGCGEDVSKIDSYGECKIGYFVLRFGATRYRQNSNVYQLTIDPLSGNMISGGSFSGNHFAGRLNCDDGTVLNLENGLVLKNGEIYSPDE